MQQANCKGNCYVIMGVSGCGKSTVGARLAENLKCGFLEGDLFHPPANIQKMESGIPLTDEDRYPWLKSLAEEIHQHSCRENLVVSCSALKHSYRKILSGSDEASQQYVRFVLLNPLFQTVEKMTKERFENGGHFMPPSLLRSQFETLEFEENELFLKIEEEDGIWPSKDTILETILQKILC